MSIRCSNCGANKRPGAKFCTVCGKRVLAPQAPPPIPTPLPQQLPPQPPIRPVQGQVFTPNPSPAVPPSPFGQPNPPPKPSPGAFSSLSLGQLLGFGPAVQGQVNFVDQDRQEKTPFTFNLAGLMIRLSFLLLFLAFCVWAAQIAIEIFLSLLTLMIVLAVIAMFFGGGCLLSTLLGLLSSLLSSLVGPILSLLTGMIFKSAGGQQSKDAFISVLSFQVVDHSTGGVVDVVLYRNTGEGNVRQGDKVKVYGKVQRSKVVRASKIQVYESGGRATNYTINAMKPWPIWLGLLVLGATIAGLVYQAMEMGWI